VIGWPEQLVLVRHGQSIGNVANAEAYSRQADRLDLDVSDPLVTLSEVGRKQAEALGTRWGEQTGGRSAGGDLPPPPDLCVASPYLRAQQTADVLLSSAGWIDLPRITDERLRDREQGIVDRLTSYGISAQFPAEATRRADLGKFYYRPPGGESWADVALRVRDLLRDLRLDHAGKRILIVSHDVPILVTRYVLEGLSLPDAVALSGQVVNCGVTVYDREGDHMTLERFNDATPVAEDADATVTAHAEQE
jgi:broad specificity phosphatase PhoE